MDGQTRSQAPPRSVLRRLADLSAAPGQVLSVYLDLDPSVFPTRKERQAEIDGLLSQAEEAFVTRGLEPDERHRRAEAVERVRDVITDPDVATGGTRSVAVFASPDADVFEVVPLGEPMPPSVVVSDAPYLRPLADEAAPRTWVVLLVDRQNARILYGGPHRLIEVKSFADPVVSHQKAGGWSSPRYQRHSDDAAADHIQHTVKTLLDFYERSPFDALAVAAPDPTYNEVVDALNPSLLERLEGRVRIEVDFPTPAQVLEAAAPIFEEAREKAIDEIVSTLEEASRDRVAIGPADVFSALSDRRVDTLVVEERFSVPGVRCPECGWIALEGARCGFDQTPTERREDVVEDAVDLALQQAARVVNVATDGERRPPNPICALLRF